MVIKYEFKIDPDTIKIQDPFTGYQLEVANMAVYRKSSGTIIALGTAAEKVKEGLRKQVTKPATSDPLDNNESDLPDDPDICYQRLFSADGSCLKYEMLAMEYFAQFLHRQSIRARLFVHLAAKITGQFDYYLTIQGYEGFDESRRSAFEQNLQANLRFRRLFINNKSLEIPLWKRNVEFWTRRFLTIVLPVAMMFWGYLKMPAQAQSSALMLLVYLLLITYGVYYLGKVLWMLLARRLLPADYRMCMLKGNRPQLSGFESFLIKLLWKN